MRKITCTALLAAALGLVACAGNPRTSSYGSFVQSAALNQQKLADDAAQQLVKLHAPARSRLDLQQPTPDPFGQALVKALRDKGYAVLEFGPTAPTAMTSEAAASTAAQASPPGAGGQSLRYVLDQAGDANLYRLTLHIGGQSITRAYQAQNDVLVPAGAWARKE